ncbi:MAG TPA: hypothetical protein VFM79_11745, partial [Pelobium sp.]|nr:hypothetical protein [Pelobium sp.]
MNSNKILPFLLLAFTLFFGFHLQAQTINEQFKTLVDGSNNYQEYKVINEAQIKNLWKNTVDSLNGKEAKYIAINQLLTKQKAAIEEQKNQLANKEKSL